MAAVVRAVKCVPAALPVPAAAAAAAPESAVSDGSGGPDTDCTGM